MLRPGPFQGAGAFPRGCARSVDVVQEQDLPRDGSLRRNGERSPDVVRPPREREAGLRRSLADPAKQQGVEGPAGAPGHLSGDQRGEVESAPEIFPGMDRNRDDDGTEPVRKEVRPFRPERPEEADGDRVDRQREALVFPSPDGLPDLLPVREEGAGGPEGGIGGAVGAGCRPVRAGREQGGGEGPAARADRARPGGPAFDDGSGDPAGFPGDQGPEERQLREQRPEQRPERGMLSGPSPGWRAPSVRGRWRTRSRCRRRGTGRST